MTAERFFILLIFSMVLAGSPLHAGSMYDEATYRPLMADHRAYQVGDLLTVLIFESSSAKSSADTDTDKSVGVGLNAKLDHRDVDGELDVSSDFQGGGTLARAGKLVATVSVSIVERLPNGDFRVAGEQRIEMNNETQNISVSGRVRAADISPQNAVISSRLADSVISYSGEGLLSDREKPGVVTKFFNWLF